MSIRVLAFSFLTFLLGVTSTVAVADVAIAVREAGDGFIVEATIGADGKVIDAKVLRSVPLLDQAALDAVRQWEYAPTLLNGVPVPVVMTVTINFKRE